MPGMAGHLCTEYTGHICYDRPDRVVDSVEPISEDRMPTTVNGIGTHYYGKKNRQSRQGVCLRVRESGHAGIV